MSRIVSLTTCLVLSALLATAAAASKGDAEVGKQTYTAQCLICHGQAGDGQGPAGVALTPKPTDFTNAGWWAEQTDAGLMSAIKRGATGTSMKAHSMSREPLEHLVAYLRTFQPGE